MTEERRQDQLERIDRRLPLLVVVSEPIYEPPPEDEGEPPPEEPVELLLTADEVRLIVHEELAALLATAS